MLACGTKAILNSSATRLLKSTKATGVPVNLGNSSGYYHLGTVAPTITTVAIRLYRLTTPFIGDTLALLDTN